MKKTSVFVAIAAVAMTAAVALAQTNVYSRNAVGAIRLELQRGKFQMVGHTLNPLGTNASTPALVLGTNNVLPIGAAVFIWDPTAGASQSGAYITENLRSNGRWNPGTNNLAGRAFWIMIPPSAASNLYTVFLMGEVPDSTTAPTSQVGVVGGGSVPQFNMLTYRYPTPVAFTNTTLAKAASVGDTMFVWDPNGGVSSNGAYVTCNKRSNGSWGGANGTVLQPGQGFWFATKTPSNLWVEVKPYLWP